MSTNAFIGIRENGSISYIYNHSDGYLEYLGRMLLEHYNSEEKAKALVALGDVSIVKEKLKPAEGRCTALVLVSVKKAFQYFTDETEMRIGNLLSLLLFKAQFLMSTSITIIYTMLRKIELFLQVNEYGEHVSQEHLEKIKNAYL